MHWCLPRGRHWRLSIVFCFFCDFGVFFGERTRGSKRAARARHTPQDPEPADEQADPTIRITRVRSRCETACTLEAGGETASLVPCQVPGPAATAHPESPPSSPAKESSGPPLRLQNAPGTAPCPPSPPTFNSALRRGEVSSGSEAMPVTNSSKCSEF